MFIRTLIFIFIICFSETSLAQNGPTGINGYEINKTTIGDIISNKDGITIKYESSFDKIKNVDELQDALLFADDSTECLVPKIYELIYPEDGQNISSRFLKLTDSVRIFFVNQMQLGNSNEYLVNNVFLTFYRDTLAVIDYNIPRKTISLFMDKYGAKLRLMKKRKEKSDCTLKSGKTAITNDILEYGINNKEKSVFSTLEVHFDFNSDCEYEHFANVSLMNMEKYKQIMAKAVSNIKKIAADKKQQKEKTKKDALNGL